MRRKQPALREQARRMMGTPVCVELKNGSYYIGYITGIDKGELILSAKKGRGKLRRTSIRSRKARVSGLLPGLASLFNMGGGANDVASEAAGGQGGGGLLGGFGGLGGFIGFMQKAWPAVRMGMGMVKTIMPLLGSLKA